MGGKSAACAHNSAAGLAGADGDAVPGAKAGVAPCRQHWIGVRIEDEDGKPVRDVAVHLSMTDGSNLVFDTAVQAPGADGGYRTAKAFPAGDCEISLPAVQDVEWWAKGGSAAKLPAGNSCSVKGGDCALSIADALGFRNYHSAWDHGSNTALRNARKNANMLAAGDTLLLPDAKQQTAIMATDQVWVFVVRKHQPARLRLVLVGADDKPLDGIAWKMKSPLVKAGTTGADGLVAIDDLPRRAKTGEIEFTLKPAPTFGKVANVAGTATDYPPKIKHEQFKDAADREPPGRGSVSFQLAIGSLAAFDAPGGALARLHNLGFGSSEEADASESQRSVKAYQRLFKKENAGSGKLADIQDDLRNRHDKA